MGLAGDLIVESMDFPKADEIGKRLKTMLPQQLAGAPSPEIQQMIEAGKAQMQQMAQAGEQQAKQIEAMQAMINKLIADNTAKMAGVEVDRFEAETDRMKALSDMQKAGTNVPDAPGPDGDYLGMARAGKLQAETDLVRVKTAREAMAPLRQQMPPQPFQGPQRF